MDLTLTPDQEAVRKAVAELRGDVPVAGFPLLQRSKGLRLGFRPGDFDERHD